MEIKMSGLGSLINVSEEDFERTVGGEIPRGTSIGCGYRFACVIPVTVDREGTKEKGAVYLARGGYSGVRRIVLTKGVFGLTQTEGPFSKNDRRYEKYLELLDSWEKENEQ